MGRSHHPLPAQAHAGGETLVVRKGGSMTLCKKHSKYLCWACIMEARPDLNPPGFYETIDKLYKKEDSDEPKQQT